MTDVTKLQERIDQLESDNAALTAMLQRRAGDSAAPASTPAGLGEVSAFAMQRQHQQIEKLQEELRLEREKRIGAQAMLSETKDRFELSLTKKETEVKRLTDIVHRAKVDIEEYEKKSKADSLLIDELRVELARLQRQNSLIGAESRTATVRKPHKPFSAVLRALAAEVAEAKAETASSVPRAQPAASSSATAAGNGSRPTSGASSNVILSPTKGLGARRATSSDPKAPANRAASANRTTAPAPAAARTPVSATTGAAANRSVSPGDANRGKRGQEVRVGDKVTWNGHAATVRYLGTVHCLGEAIWAGLEIATPGAGDHNGTMSGIRYFNAPAKQAVFCRPAEVSFPKAKPLSGLTETHGADVKSTPVRSRSANGGAVARSSPAPGSRGTPSAATKSSGSSTQTPKRAGALPSSGSPQEKTQAESSSPAKTEATSQPAAAETAQPAAAAEPAPTQAAAEPAPTQAAAEPAPTQAAAESAPAPAQSTTESATEPAKPVAEPAGPAAEPAPAETTPGQPTAETTPAPLEPVPPPAEPANSQPAAEPAQPAAETAQQSAEPATTPAQPASEPPAGQASESAAATSPANP